MSTYWRYSPRSQAYSATDPAAQYQPDFPVTNIQAIEAPSRVARSLTLTSAPILLYLGTHTGIGAFSLYGANFGSLLIEGNVTDSWGSPSFSQSFNTTGVNTSVGHRFRLCLPTAPFLGSYRYVRLTPSSPDAGAMYFELAAVAPWLDLKVLNGQFRLPYDRSPLAETESVKLGGGTVEYGVPGSFFAQIALGGGAFWFDQSPDATAQAQWEELSLLPDGRTFLWWEEYRGVNYGYHVRRTALMKMSSQGTPQAVEVSGIEFTEVV